MLVKDIGEFALIDRLAKAVEARGLPTPAHDATGHRIRIGIGDDAAVWDGPAGATMLTTDTMVDGVHFLRGKIGWRDLGWKSMASNLSDVAAMGCVPLYAVVTLGLTGDLLVEGITEMYEGMMDALERHGGAIVGGDVVSSPVFFITVAFTGAARGAVPLQQGEVVQMSIGTGEGAVLTRSAARVGDVIAVTGPLGCSAAGLRMVLEGLEFDRGTAAHLLEAHYRPAPRVREGMVLLRHGVRACIDVSDGLLADLSKLCKASAVGALVKAEQVPSDEVLKSAFPREWLELALAGGEDYELLFTAPPEVFSALRTQPGLAAHPIGEIVPAAAGVRVLDATGGDISPGRIGWDHFNRRKV